MLAYIFRRLLWTPVLLAAVSLVTFALGHYGPGDPVQVLMGQHTNPEVLARIRHERGLDRPFFAQYAAYMGGVLRGDFGESFKFQGRPVNELVFTKIGVSAQLGLAAIIIAVLAGIPLGLAAALKQGTWADTATVSATLLFMSMPVFITAPVLIMVFVLWLRILPSSGWGGFFDPTIIMPAFVLALPSVAVLTRLMRASTLEVIGQDYIRTARAKGLSEFVVQYRHVLRNAIIPVFTVIGLSLGTLVEGAFITETMFGIPGVGRLGLDSLFARDYPVIMALTLIVAISFIVANLLVDIGYAFLDPRIRYE
ncbi:MAG: ABC transporter permease [Chloroflexota bacterium]|nr:ABC transporter permease [Chloroflexota bacterium]